MAYRWPVGSGDDTVRRPGGDRLEVICILERRRANPTRRSEQKSLGLVRESRSERST